MTRSRRRGRGRRSRASSFNPLLVGGIVLAVVAIFGLLFIPNYIENTQACQDGGFKSSDFAGDKCVVDKKYSYDDIIIVAGNTANSPEPTIERSARKILANSISRKGGAHVVIISASSANSKIVDKVFQLSGDSENGFDYFISDVDKQIQEIEGHIKEKPSSDGAAYLEAIIRGVSLAYDNNAKLIIIGSGLSDGGMLDFANSNFFGMELEQIESKINAMDLPKSRSKIDSALWIGIGNTTLPQKEIGKDSNLNKLKTAYTKAIANIFGVADSSIEYREELSSSTSIDTDRIVKPTDVPMCYSQSLNLDFVAGKTDFRGGKESAKNALNEAAQAIRQCPKSNVRVTGYVALESCSAPADVNLAKGRAEAVKSLLTEMGVTNSIISAGSGDRIVSECVGGRIDQALAQQNRIVKIIVEK